MPTIQRQLDLPFLCLSDRPDISGSLFQGFILEREASKLETLKILKDMSVPMA